MQIMGIQSVQGSNDWMGTQPKKEAHLSSVHPWFFTPFEHVANRLWRLLWLLWLFSTRTEGCQAVYGQNSLLSNWQGTSMAKNSSPSRAPKTGAQLQTTWRSAKNAEKPTKSPSHRHSSHTVRISMNCASRPAQQGHRPRSAQCQCDRSLRNR